MKYFICLIYVMLMAITLAFSGCSWSVAGGARAETYYPNTWQKGGDPAYSRASGVDVASSSTPGRNIPIPTGGK